MFSLRRLIGSTTEPSPEDEEMIVHRDPRLPVHVLADDARLMVQEGNPVVEGGEGTCRALRTSEISLVALHGGATVTAPCLALLAEHGIPLVLLSRRGYYRGQLVDLSEQSTRTRRAHYHVAEDASRSLAIVRPLVEAKLANARHLLRRRLGASDRRVQLLRRQQLRVRLARSLKALRGTEGAAGAAYWETWPELLRNDSDLFTFDGRSRRPPRDAVNALLSYLYAVATGFCSAVALGAGLDPRVGFLHSERPGRPALALDLVEPLRVAVVDACVITSVNRREFQADHFTFEPEHGVRLSADGRRLALEVFEHRLSTEVSYGGRATSWRAATTRYALALASHLREGGRPPDPPRLS